jgi:hypothetical protein
MKSLINVAVLKPQVSPNAGETAKGRITNNFRQRNFNLLSDDLSPSENPHLLKNINEDYKNLNKSIKLDSWLNDAFHSRQENSLKALLREYTLLNAKIITEHLVLTNEQLEEEHTLRREVFNLLRQKGGLL